MAIANYIDQVQAGQDKGIDYLLITHFHEDHYSSLNEPRADAPKGGYKLSGVTELPEYMPIRKLVDRDYPLYNVPVNMKQDQHITGDFNDATFQNYLRFIGYQKKANKMSVEKFDVGSKSQFAMKNNAKGYPSFYVQNIKCNNMLWTGKDKEVRALFDPQNVLTGNGKHDENPLSCALVINYGKFRYYAGGDNNGLVDQDLPAWRDIETPMAAVVGKVSAMTLNHHGNRDATNSCFLNSLDPQVVIMQTWSSDHPGQEVARRLVSKNLGSFRRDIYVTRLDPLTCLGIGNSILKNVKSDMGHYLLRVYPNGTFEVYTLDCTSKELKVIAKSRLYEAKN